MTLDRTTPATITFQAELGMHGSYRPIEVKWAHGISVLCDYVSVWIHTLNLALPAGTKSHNTHQRVTPRLKGKWHEPGNSWITVQRLWSFQIQPAVSPSLTSSTQLVRVSERGPLFKVLSQTIKKKKMRKCGEGEMGGGRLRFFQILKSKIAVTLHIDFVCH